MCANYAGGNFLLLSRIGMVTSPGLGIQKKIEVVKVDISELDKMAAEYPEWDFYFSNGQLKIGRNIWAKRCDVDIDEWNDEPMLSDEDITGLSSKEASDILKAVR
jgi:hypothetical protein